MNIIEKLIEVIKSNFYSIFTFVSVSVFIVFVYSYFIAEKTYISDSKLFVYGESSSVSELKSLALEYGVSLPASGGQQANFSSPELFVNLTKSKTVLKSLANQSFSLTNGDSKSLKEHLLKKSLSSIFSNKENIRYTLNIPNVDYYLTPFLMTIPLQLLAYHVASLKNYDIDKPRNLAKSVTVE